MIKSIENIGAANLSLLGDFRDSLRFSARVFLDLFSRKSYNSASMMVFIHQFYFTSVQILPLFLLVAVIFGSVINGIAFQVIKNLGLGDYLGRLLMGFVVTELSPFVTVLLVALRSSSAINAEIAVMKVIRELDTLEVFGIDLIRYLCIPRILNGMLSMVLLTCLFALVVLFIGLLVSSQIFATGFDDYIEMLLRSSDIGDLLVLLVKCATFGFFITLIPLRTGLNATGDVTGIPVAVLNGMVKVFLAIVTIEVMSSIIRFI